MKTFFLKKERVERKILLWGNDIENLYLILEKHYKTWPNILPNKIHLFLVFSTFVDSLVIFTSVYSM